MSYGMTPYEFVQQVYYAQEKVILDFRPDDDKYKEVLTEGNFVLQELQNLEDWTWLREKVVLGSVDGPPQSIPEFQLPEWVYKPSTLHNDNLRLHHACGCRCEDYDEFDFIEVPYVSAGRLQGRSGKEYMGPSTNVPNMKLGARVVGNNVLTFTRPLLPWERRHRVAVADVQRRLPLLHICNDDCPRDEDGRCTLIEDRVFTEIPDPNYVVIKTAAIHAEGSPPAQGRLQSLTDNAQKLLSAMRQNDSSATDPDYIEWDHPWHVNVV